MTDAELEAEVLRHRPEWAQDFAEKGNPATWSDMADLREDERALCGEMYEEWRADPEAFLVTLSATPAGVG